MKMVIFPTTWKKSEDERRLILFLLCPLPKEGRRPNVPLVGLQRHRHTATNFYEQQHPPEMLGSYGCGVCQDDWMMKHQHQLKWWGDMSMRLWIRQGPRSVSEELFGFWLLIQYLSNSTNIQKYWDGNAVYYGFPTLSSSLMILITYDYSACNNMVLMQETPHL